MVIPAGSSLDDFDEAMPRLNSKNRDLEVEFTLDEELELDPSREYGGVMVDSRYYTNRKIYAPSPL